MNKPALFSLSLAIAALGGCATDRPGPMRQVAYGCDRGAGITVQYSGNEAAIIGSGGERIVMQQRPSGSGFWYQSPTHSIRGKGDMITYTVGRMVPMTCTALQPMPR